MKKILYLILMCGFSFQFLIAQNQGKVSYHGQLSINGSKIVNQYSDTVSFAGPSLFWSNTWWGGDKYYTAEVVDWVAQDWDATIIRAAMGVDESGGYLTSTTNKTANYERITTVIDAAIDNDMYVIVDWHSHHAEDYETEAIAFFTAIAQEYGDNPNIMYEIYNEPLEVPWSTVIKPYAESVIAAIREYDTDNIIVVGTPIWSQKVDDAAANPITDYDNIAYTAHFYAGTHTQWLRDRILAAMNDGIAIIITEWGTVDSDGNGGVATESSNAWVDFMKEHDITNCNWALNDKNEGASALVPGASTAGYWSDSDLTTSGKYVYQVIKNWEGALIPDESGGSQDPENPEDPQEPEEPVVSLDNLNHDENVNVFVNNAQQLIIQLPDNFQNASFVIYSQQGQKLVHEHNVRVQTSQVPLQNYVPGLYIVIIRLHNTIHQYKIIKK
ncbi:MAG: cellulase family glycosylhydrolase [Bacteroidales bacterium]|jgi:endoglucanase|nr:cellulase family glycosylhydrolase [Bacteroidales bacterium]